MKKNESLMAIKTAKHEFDLLSPLKNGELEVSQAVSNDAKQLSQFCKNAIPNSVSCPLLIKRVISHNAENVFVFKNNDQIAGVYAMLMLRALGLEQLLLGKFNGKNPNFMYLAKNGEIPAAIYVWSYVAPGAAANGIRYVSQLLQQPKYRNVNFFARPVTKAGIRITKNLGYEPLESIADGLYRYVRLVNREPKLQHAA